MDCEFCKKSFSNISSLNFHKKTAKYCLKIQNKSPDEDYQFICSYCNKHSTSLYNLKEHVLICKKKQDHEHQKFLSELGECKEKIEEYREKIENQQQIIYNIAINSVNKNVIPSNISEKLNNIQIEKNDNNISTTTLSTLLIKDFIINSRHPDHYVNADDICKFGEKPLEEWFLLNSTTELIEELSKEIKISTSFLVENKNGSVWLHPELAIQLSYWVSNSLYIKVSQWIRSLFKSVTIDIALVKAQEIELNVKNQRIKELENICMTKQKRLDFPEKNVIYILTTEDHIKRGVYIIGKTKNLTNRLSTYNKTCEHTVIYHKECKDEDNMNTVELLVLNRLKPFKEKANRDRFILPEDRDVSFFIEIIDQCVNFLE